MNYHYFKFFGKEFFAGYISMNETIKLQNILADILKEYSIGEVLAENLDNTRKNYNQELYNIKEGYGLNNKSDKIKKYAAYSIKKHINDKNTYGSRRYDWEIISDKDYSADLLSFIADYILCNNDIAKSVCGNKILKTLENNIEKYYEEEFEEKIEESKNYYQQFGNFDCLVA